MLVALICFDNRFVLFSKTSRDPAIFVPRPSLFRFSLKYCLGSTVMTSVITMSVTQEFLDVIAKHDFQPDQILVVANKLTLIDSITVKDFLGYFSSGPTVYTFRDGIPEWKQHGNDLAKLRDMLMTFQDSEAEARERENLILDNRIDNPIDKKTHDTLTEVWLARYGSRLHPTQEGTHQIMGGIGAHCSSAKPSQNQSNRSAPFT